MLTMVAKAVANRKILVAITVFFIIRIRISKNSIFIILNIYRYS